jgi:hypothetical protein
MPPVPAPLIVDVELQGDSEGHSAVIRVSGRKTGLRRLRAKGLTCAELEESLLASLELLFDGDPATPVSPEFHVDAQDSGVAHPSSSKRGKIEGVWAGGGFATTAGLPYGRSQVPFVEVGLQLGTWRLLGSAVFPPRETVPFGRGDLELHAIGGQLALCPTVLSTKSLAVLGCGVAMGLLLSADAHDFTANSSRERPWWLAGAGPELQWSATSWMELGVSARALASLHGESFDVRPLGSGYQTPAVVGWLATDAKVRFW